ncbi:Sensor protein [Oleispira antarctica RB-8]|uniref:histidine kinase n=1 Tax=Oleispira antarctica RB-8 TaxID=698738 RepID=R4YQD5_OLEAN|nr:Sensor protein [Oleispira antarctica RB-8]
MRIMPSIRLYVLLSMLLTGGGIIWGLSALSSYYFVSGLDISTRNSMLAFAYQQKNDKQFTFVTPEVDSIKKQKRTITYGLIKDWKNLPLVFQNTYKPSELVLDKFYKHLEKTSLFTPPKTGSFIIKIMKDNEIYYATLIISNGDKKINSISDLNNFVVINLTALAVIILFTLILLFVMRQVTLPVKRLKDWAKNLKNQQLSQDIPDFHYSELNILASLIRDSLDSVQKSLEREKKFLGYASHELRTPIAVSHSNSELLKKLIENNCPREKQLQVLARIFRANLTMTSLTETLLWLNRREGKELVARDLQLGILTEQLVNELKYLTEGKVITLSVETDHSSSELPEGVCRIITSNLIRNAFQHTTEGRVFIKQEGCHLSVINQNSLSEERIDVFEGNSLEKDNLGFGLGLSLTQRIIEQYQWQYEATDITGGKSVSVIFKR